MNEIHSSQILRNLRRELERVSNTIQRGIEDLESECDAYRETIGIVIDVLHKAGERGYDHDYVIDNAVQMLEDVLK